MEGRKGQPSREIKPYDYSSRPFIDREITDRSVKYIEDHAKGPKPFFLYIPFTLPHDPPLAHPDFDKPNRSQYQNVLDEIDHNAGRVIDAVASAGIANNTIVIFTSDNGPQTPQGKGSTTAGNPIQGRFGASSRAPGKGRFACPLLCGGLDTSRRAE